MSATKVKERMFNLVIACLLLVSFSDSALASNVACPDMLVGPDQIPIDRITVKGVSCDDVKQWISDWAGSNPKPIDKMVDIMKDGQKRGMRVKHTFVKPSGGGPLDTLTFFVMTYKGKEVSFRRNASQPSINH